VTNKTFFPVPAGKNLCSQAPSAPAGIDALGCIAVIKGKNDKDDCVAEGAPVIAVTDDGDSRFHKGECRDHDHEHDKD